MNKLLKCKTLHELLELGLSDFEAIKYDKRYKRDLNAWHDAEPYICYVGLEGAVMARTLGIDCDEYYQPSYFDKGIEHRLYAIDTLVKGEIKEAFTNDKIDKLCVLLDDHHKTTYHSDKNRNKKSIEKTCELLRELQTELQREGV